MFLSFRSERNRKHAKKSRQRKKEFNKCLQESIDALKAENDRLCSMLDIEKGSQLLQNQDDIGDDLVAALQEPKNRVLGDDVLASLQSLFR